MVLAKELYAAVSALLGLPRHLQYTTMIHSRTGKRIVNTKIGGTAGALAGGAAGAATGATVDAGSEGRARLWVHLFLCSVLLRVALQVLINGLYPVLWLWVISAVCSAAKLERRLQSTCNRS